MQHSIRRYGKNVKLSGLSFGAEAAFHLILGLFSIACVVPFIFVIIISFSAESSLRTVGFSFMPNLWSVESYQYVFRWGDQLWRSYFNSFFITAAGTVISVLICILYSYSLFRRDFKLRKFFTFLSFITMMFGGGLVPTYMVCKNILGLNDNYAAMIVPLLVSPFLFIVMRTFFSSTVPEALIESAAIDGSGEYRTLFQIIVPISKPGIATVALLNALAYWNEWFIAMLYIRSAKYIPLQYLLMKMQNQVDFLAKNSALIGAEAANIVASTPKENLRMALVVFIVAPIACAYPFFQRYIVSGLTIGSVKG
ncbi:MAG: carbohydrate ABC transporter permease [Oscillospiraceae bacterium]|jgi:putative aldouronate transport system permease protein|nr:carbohydrate ABC transporter permease [Oscillospiraceae bacterium]